MAEHDQLTDPKIHEPKGASTAIAQRVYVSDGAGSGSWQHFADPFEPNIAIEELISESSLSLTQEPPLDNSDVEYQIEYGPGVVSGDGTVTLSANGDLTFNTAGTYYWEITHSVGRDGGAGTAYFLIRGKFGGFPVGSPSVFSTDSASAIARSSSGVWLTVPAGTAISVWGMRDSAGSNDGGLRGLVPTNPDWAAVPTASVIVRRMLV